MDSSSSSPVSIREISESPPRKVFFEKNSNDLYNQQSNDLISQQSFDPTSYNDAK